MSTIVKICGVTSEEAVDAGLDHGADMMGFVFFPRSPRHLSLNAAARLTQRVGRRARKVLLTVDADDALLMTLIPALAPDILQLHGHETPERVAAIRARFGLPVMKAIAIGEASDLDDVARFEPLVDFFLFDAKPAPAAKLPGGNGTAFDWTLLRAVETRKPWLLAGGLDPENVDAALRLTGAPGVDVSSGVEETRGVKDPDKIAAFIGKVRALEKRGPEPMLGSTGQSA